MAVTEVYGLPVIHEWIWGRDSMLNPIETTYQKKKKGTKI